MADPSVDQLDQAARDSVRRYAGALRSAIGNGETPVQAGATMVRALNLMNTDRDTVIALFVVALLELVAPPPDLSHLDL